MKYVDPQGLLELEVDFALKYPKAAKRIMSLGERMTWIKYTSMREYGRTTESRIKAALAPGHGPTVCADSLPWSNDYKVYGEFRKERDPTKIFLNTEMLKIYETGQRSGRGLDDTVEHELVHLFNFESPGDYPGEEGNLYDKSVYDGPVWK